MFVVVPLLCVHAQMVETGEQKNVCCVGYALILLASVFEAKTY